MKFMRASALFSAAAVVAAHDSNLNNRRHEHVVRQQQSSSAAAAPSGAATSLTFSLKSTNPTALPFESFAQGAPTQPTPSLSATPTAGSEPSDISGAPALPAISIVPSSYPALDKTPPTDSPEVAQWKQEVADSGIEIPDIQPTVAGMLATSSSPQQCH